jgi:hypothetical protein
MFVELFRTKPEINYLERVDFAKKRGSLIAAHKSTPSGENWGQTELTRVSRTLQNGIILPEEVSNGKASDLQ